MLAEDRLRDGDPEASLRQLQEQVRKEPANARHRVGAGLKPAPTSGYHVRRLYALMDVRNIAFTPGAADTAAITTADTDLG